MSLIQDKIGNADVLFFAASDQINAKDNTTTNERGGRTPTSADGRQTDTVSKTVAAFEKAKSTIFNIAIEFEEEIKKREITATTIGMEFNISLSAKADLWVIGAEGSSGFHVTLNWENKERKDEAK